MFFIIIEIFNTTNTIYIITMDKIYLKIFTIIKNDKEIKL